MFKTIIEKTENNVDKQDILNSYNLYGKYVIQEKTQITI